METLATPVNVTGAAVSILPSPQLKADVAQCLTGSAPLDRVVRLPYRLTPDRHDEVVSMVRVRSGVVRTNRRSAAGPGLVVADRHRKLGPSCRSIAQRHAPRQRTPISPPPPTIHGSPSCGNSCGSRCP